MRGEFRERIEGFEGIGFIDDRDDAYWLSRFRLNAAVTASKHLSFQANVQDARVADKEVGPTTAPFRGPFDLRAGFADIGDAKAPVAARLGRQELAFGEQRLLGHLAWVNTGRTWDAARVIVRAKALAGRRLRRLGRAQPCRTNSTRAATATVSPACMRRRRK